MPRQHTKRSALTVGQVAAHWGVSVDRVRALIDCGEIQNVFVIPSSGRYGETTKIPHKSVLEAEAKWLIQGNGARPKPPRTARRQNGSPGPFKHFPELDVSPESLVETHEAERR